MGRRGLVVPVSGNTGRHEEAAPAELLHPALFAVWVCDLILIRPSVLVVTLCQLMQSSLTLTKIDMYIPDMMM